MTNPDNIVRVRARNGGRASVYEANGWGQAYSSGLLEGNGVVQNTVADMNVLVGGSTTKPDVVLAENPAGYRIGLDLVGQQPIAITAPATNSRISAIVAYTDDLSLESTEDTVTGSPASCGLIVVNGTAGAEPSEPTDSQIRTAITADGATGSQAAYAIIATIEVASDTTIITDSLININQAAIPSSKLDFTTSEVQLTFKADGTTVTGTANATLLKFDNNIGVLLYRGNTGWNDAASGNRELVVDFDAGFKSIIGSSVNSSYSGMPESYQRYSYVYTDYLDNYVNKPDSTNRMRNISFVIFGKL